jgi:hypothetical protein
MTFAEFVVEAMRFRGLLAREFGYYTEVTVEDNGERGLVCRYKLPPLGERSYEEDESVGEKCESWEFENGLEEFKSAQQFLMRRHVQREMLRQHFKTMTPELLTALRENLQDVKHFLP